MSRSSLLLPFFLLIICAAMPGEAMASEALRDFQRDAAKLLEANGVPGAGIVLVKDGEITWAGGIGYAELETGRPVLATTPFRIGSITKMFTAVAVMQLVEQGKLSLDQPVRDVAPELPVDNPWHDTDPVRIVHLLEHTAGFDEMHFHNMSSDAPLPDSLATTVAALEHELAVRWRPGVKHAYSNPGYAVAGHLVEQLTGVPFHEYVEKHLLEPLRLENAGWGNPAGTRLAQGYTGDERRPIAPRAIRLYPAGELSASPNDMARLVRFFLEAGELDGERLLTRESVTRMETPRTTRAARHGLENGYGLGNHTIFREGVRLQGHDGGLDGFNAEMAYSRENGFGYAVLLNRSNGGVLHALGDLAVRFLAQDIEDAAVANAQSAALPKNLDGCYRMTNPRNELLYGLEWLVQVTCMRMDGERVLLRHPVLPQLEVFVPAGGTLLREARDASPTAVFMQDPDRVDAFEWRGIYFERSNRLAVTMPPLLALLALLLMASAILFAPVWLLRRKYGGLRGAPAMSARAWPLAASILFFVTLWWSTRLELSLLDSVNVITVGVFIGGVAFVLVSAFALYRVGRTWKAGIHPVAKWHSLLVAMACTGVSLYLIGWRLVPLRVWAW